MVGAFPVCERVFAMTRFWICSCTACVILVGGRRRDWTLCSSSSSTGSPALSGVIHTAPYCMGGGEYPRPATLVGMAAVTSWLDCDRL